MKQNFNDFKKRIGFDIHQNHECHLILDTARKDEDLLVCLRGKKIHIYYKGGKILEMEETTKDCSLSFDVKYLGTDAKKTFWMDKKYIISNPEDYFQQAKIAMDSWFQSHPKEERDDQHKIALQSSIDDENGLSVIDIEYAVSFNSHAYNKAYIDANAPHGKEYSRYPNPRFDIIAVDSNGQLYVLELKTGLGSLSNLKKHILDFENTIGSIEKGDDDSNDLLRWQSFVIEIAEMTKVLNAKQYRTKLLPEVNTDLPPKFLFVFTPKDKANLSDEEKKKQENVFKNILKKRSIDSALAIFPQNYKLTISE